MPDFDALKSAVLQDWKALAKWREQAQADAAFRCGHQWTAEETAAMEENQRIPIVFNRVAPIMASVAGSEINNRTEVRFIPREIGDVKPNEILSRGAEWFRDASMAEDEESIAFEDCLTCGVGFTETTLDFEEDPEGAPTINRIPPWEVAWDASCARKGLRDARRFHRVRRIERAEAREMFPDADPADLSADWIDRDIDEPETTRNEIGDEYRGESETEERSRDLVTIVQTQWRERVRVVEYIEPATGQRAEMPAADWARIEKAGLVAGVQSRRYSRHEWRQAFLGKVILKENQPCAAAPTFNAITANYDTKERQWFGLLRCMRDPQRFANKWLSTTLHIIASNAKGGIWAKRGVAEDDRQFEESWSATDAVTWLDRSAVWGQDIGEKPKADMPAALMALTEFAISSIRDVSGVNMELLGMRDANQPGILEYQRRQSAMTTLAAYFDSMRFYRKRQGSVILHYLREYIGPSGRLVRILEDGQERFVSLALADDTAKYDVIIDDAPQSPNEKEKNWSIIQQMLPVIADKLDAEMWLAVAEVSPLPSAFVEKLRSKLEQQKQAGPDPREQLALADMQAEVRKKTAAAQLDEVKAAVEQADAQVKPMMAQADMIDAQARATTAQTEAQMARPRMLAEMMTAQARARKDEADAMVAPLKAMPRPTGYSGAGQ